MDVPVTTDAEVVSEFLKNEPAITSILLSTYQSSKVLSEAVKKTGIGFDTAIFDEAHRTTGSDVGVWNMAIDDKNVTIKKRIFMTATPRIYAPHISKKAKENDILLYSMDDNEVYGKPFYEMTFGQAIEKNLITDYKVVIICVTDREVREIIQQGGRVVTDDNKEWDAKAFAKQVALVKAIEAYKLKKVFTFHSRVPSAKAFTQTDSPYSIKEVIKMLNPPHSDPLPQGARESSFVAPPLRGGDEGEGDKINLFHVNGTMSSGFRNSIMKEFRESEIGIMSNARCLIEGVDVPAVDTVAFIDPKKSIIDIVQATGRALRKAEWKEKGYIFIPVVVDEDTTPEDFLKSSDFDTVWEVLQAMMDQDQRLESIVSQLRTMQGESKEDSEEWQNTMSEYAEKVEFYKLTEKIDHKRFVKNLYTKTVELTARPWDFWYGQTLRYKKAFDAPNAEQGYKTLEGYSLGYWQTQQRSLYKKNKLSPDRIKKLEDIGFIFGSLDEAFERGIKETKKYKEQFGNANVPANFKTIEGYALGYWQAHQRRFYKQGNLHRERVKKLEEIGFNFNPLEDAFEKGFNATLKNKEKFGDANPPKRYKTPDGFNLGSWQIQQRQNYKKGKLSKKRILMLEGIGFKWTRLSKDEEAFEKGFKETVKYKERYGIPNAPATYKTQENYSLGQWQAYQRKAFSKGKLDKEKVQRLAGIGVTWALGLKIVDEFEKGLQESIQYKKKFGTPNAFNRYKTPECFKLGSWQSHQRRYYKSSKLSMDRIKRLENIGFLWDILDEAFEQGIRETLIYKEITGNANAPDGYKTPEGYNLGQWQTDKKAAYKKSRLSSDRIKRLEEIGFKWEIKK